MECSYPSSIRLKKRWEFDAVFRTGRHQKGELVRIVFLDRPGEPTKFGAVVSKKIANAVMRAHGRRLIRESLRRLAPCVTSGVWVIVSMREHGLAASAVDVWRDIRAQFERAKLMRPDAQVLPWG